MWWRKALRALFWIAIVAGVLAGIVAIFAQTWTVPGDDPQFAVSIEPTLTVGDLLLVSRSKGAEMGALVRCVDPDSPARFVVGRVMAHAGDTIEFKDGVLLVDNKSPSASNACDPATVRIKNPATQEDEDLNCTLEEFADATHPVLRGGKSVHETHAEVEVGKVFLVSDNRAMHLDSRDFTTVAPSSCQRILGRFWSASGWLDSKKRLTVLW
jgi:signal peptidase I